MKGYLRSLSKFTNYKKILLQRFMKYLAILFCFLLITCPIIFQAYRMARDRTIKRVTNQMNSALSTFSETLEKGMEICDALRTEDAFMSLLLLHGEPTSPYYPYINSLQGKLSAWCFRTDYIIDIYVSFRDNPVWIASRVNSSDSNAFYGDFFRYERLSYEQWRSILYADKYITKFIPQQQTYYTYMQPARCSTLTFLVNASPFPSVDTSCVIGYMFDVDEITEAFLGSGLKEEAVLSVELKDGTVLWQYRPGSPSSLDFDPDIVLTSDWENYTFLSAENDLIGLRATVGVPNEVFNREIASLLAIIIVYFCIGLMLAILLSVGFTIREATENVNYLQQIRGLNRAIQTSTFENLFIAGVHTEKDEKLALQNSQCSFERFCVAKIILSPSNSEVLLSVEMELKGLLHCEYLCFNTSSDELQIVLFLEHSPEINEQAVVSMFQPLVNSDSADRIIRVGISPIVSNVRKVRSASLQASKAASLSETDFSSVQLYEFIRSRSPKKIFDPTILLKLSEIIRTGDYEAAQQLFEKIRLFTKAAKLDEQDAAQLYFCLRQILANEQNDLYADGKETDATPSPLPAYSPRENMQARLNALEDATIQLCNTVNRRKKSNNLVLKEKILTYLQENYNNSNLNASVVAQALSVSEKYVFAFVKTTTGKTLGKYIEDLRLEKSEELLRTTSLTNRKIAEAVGFGSENTFYRIFAKKHGLTPTKWRENNR